MGKGFVAHATSGPIGLVDGRIAGAGSVAVSGPRYRRVAAVGLDGVALRAIRSPRSTCVTARVPSLEVPPNVPFPRLAYGGHRARRGCEHDRRWRCGLFPFRARAGACASLVDPPPGGGPRRHGCTRRRRRRRRARKRRVLGRRELGARVRRCARPRPGLGSRSQQRRPRHRRPPGRQRVLARFERRWRLHLR